MILIDERVGSRELLTAIRSMGCDAELTYLDAADFAFSGHGDPEVCVSPFVGVERKTITDLVSSMRSRRLAGHQHVHLSRCYDVIYLLVEGYWRRGRQGGYLEVMNGAWHTAKGSVKYAEVDSFITGLQHECGMHIWRTADEEETAAVVVDRYKYWQKPWGEHSLARTIYAPECEQTKRGHKPSMVRREATLCEKVAAQLPGVDSKAIAVAAHFGSVDAMFRATVKEWTMVPGIGKTGAAKIVEALIGLNS